VGLLTAPKQVANAVELPVCHGIPQSPRCFGGYSRTEPFYFKVHSPVTLLEYDNRAAIFLGNPGPEKYHTHTVMRTPNGNDYGKDLLCQHYQRYHA
jgi:hypothetical protein